MTVIGIDFGTTNSVVAAYRGGGPETLPIDEPPADWAALGFDRVLPTVFGIGSDRQPVFGWLAKSMAENKVEAVKRLFRDEETVTIGGTTFLVEEIATLLFSHMKQKAQESGLDPRRCVVTVPANSRGLARYRTKLTAGMSGMEVLALINEPTAAAMAYSARTTRDEQLMVVDWGGGTLDVTILQAAEGVFVEQASKGIQQLGGLDFDARLARAILQAHPASRDWTPVQAAEFRLAVERAKVLLSTQPFTNVALPGGEYLRVTRQQFEEAARPLVERVRGPIEQCLRDIRTPVGEIDAVLLVGGTCNIPLVRDFVADIMQRQPAEGVDPMTAVAEGAAIAAAIMSGELSDHDFFVGTEHALGTFVHDQHDNRSFSTIIPRNHKLPARSTRDYAPVFDAQDEVVVCVVEGDPDLPVDHEDNVILKEIEVQLPNRRTRLEKAIDLTYEYDLDGILHVSVQDQMTGESLNEDVIAFGVGADKKSLVALAGRVRRTLEGGIVPTEDSWRTSDLEPDVSQLLQRARTKVLPFLDGEEAAKLRHLISAVETSSGASRRESIQALDTTLVDYSYLF